MFSIAQDRLADDALLRTYRGGVRPERWWYVGERTATQLLMCDRYERTRSWFRVVSLDGGRTLLQFGSAIAAAHAEGTAPGGRFRPLLRFHVVYSQLLLHAAKIGVTKTPKAAS